MLFSRLLVDWGVRCADTSSIDALRLPDEVLEQIAVVLGEHKQLSLLDHVLEVADELLAFGRKSLGRRRQGLGFEEAVQRNVDLFVRGDLAIGKGRIDAVELELVVDILLLLLNVGGSVYGSGWSHAGCFGDGIGGR